MSGGCSNYFFSIEFLPKLYRRDKPLTIYWKTQHVSQRSENNTRGSVGRRRQKVEEEEDYEYNQGVRCDRYFQWNQMNTIACCKDEDLVHLPTYLVVRRSSTNYKIRMTGRTHDNYLSIFLTRFRLHVDVD